jgi:hypothetical protein
MTVKRPRVAIITKSMLIGYGVDEIVNFLGEKLLKVGFDVEVLANIQVESTEPSFTRSERYLLRMNTGTTTS